MMMTVQHRKNKLNTMKDKHMGAYRITKYYSICIALAVISINKYIKRYI